MKALLVAAVFAAPGCAGLSRLPCPDPAPLDRWIGQTEADLVRYKGEPTYRQTMFTRDGLPVIGWRTVRWDCPQCQGKGSGGPSANDDYCRACYDDPVDEVERYFIDANGKVVSWDWSGPWGEQYFSEMDFRRAQSADRETTGSTSAFGTPFSPESGGRKCLRY